jgi:Carboxypeptidase regulatory-like domain
MSAVSGRILDGQGKPILEAAVLAFSDDRAQWFQVASTTRFGRSDDKGEYRLSGLRAGGYFVIARPRESDRRRSMKAPRCGRRSRNRPRL